MRDEISPPALELDFNEIAKTARIDDEVWQFCVEHWNWLAEVMNQRYEEAEVDLTIGDPVEQQRLNTVLREMEMELPAEFRTVLSNYCGELEFMWGCFDADQSSLPESLQGLESGGNMPIWSIDRMAEYALAARNHKKSPWLAFVDGLRGRLPFMEDGSGDVFAFDMRNGNENCPIVYLSHENDDNVHDKQVAANFIDFLSRWSYLGCPGMSYYDLQPFMGTSGSLDCASVTSRKWRRWLTAG